MFGDDVSAFSDAAKKLLLSRAARIPINIVASADSGPAE